MPKRHRAPSLRLVHSASEVAAGLREIGRYYALLEKNFHRARAYEHGADAVQALGDRLPTLIAGGRLTEVPGIGAKLAHVIADLQLSGTTASLERLRQSFPTQLLQLAGRPGFTITRLRTLHEKLGIANEEALKQALAEGRLKALKGFGPKVEERLLASLQISEETQSGLLLSVALLHSDAIAVRLAAIAGVTQAQHSGQVRRCCEVVHEFAFVLAAAQPASVLDQVADVPELGAVVARTADQIQMQHSSGLLATVVVTTPERFGTVWWTNTGSEAHVVAVGNKARAAGLAWDQMAFASEAELYRSLQLPFIPPELRDNDGEIEAAAGGDDFEDLVTLSDLLGVVHCHTTHSDGKHTIAQMAEAAQQAGLQYITITDHSTSAPYAGGLTVDRLAAQSQEIAEVRAQKHIELLAGTESDINEDGSLDFPLSTLQNLDVIVASVHNRHRMDAAQSTARLITAMTQPVFKIWGHPLGRLLGERPPLDCDVEAILDAASNSRTAIEINGSPHRLDMEPKWLKRARARGLRFVVSADAHSTREIGYLRFGVMMARRAGIRRQEVLNTLPAADFRSVVKP